MWNCPNCELNIYNEQCWRCGANRPAEERPPKVAAAVEPKAAPEPEVFYSIQCPFCQDTMGPGTTAVSRETFEMAMSLFIQVLSLANGRHIAAANQPHYLYFFPAGGGKSIRLATSLRAFRCPSCNALVVPGTRMPETTPWLPVAEADAKGEELNCLACGATIPVGAARCAACGWTWDASSDAD